MPYYDIRHSADVREEIQKRIPYIDPRYANHSYVEGQLYDVMKGCYNMNPEKRISMEEAIGLLLKESGKTIATAESCTGGYIAHLLTSISGSSTYFKGSIISYANEVKQEVLGVSEEDLIQQGAVSQAVVEQMAKGVRDKMKTDYAVATSGVAGPDGGSDEKPVGTVWIAFASEHKVVSKKFLFEKNRERNIRRAALAALSMLRKGID